MRPLLLTLVVLSTACSPSAPRPVAVEPPQADAVDHCVTTPEAAKSPVRRLTVPEFRAAAESVLGLDASDDVTLPREEGMGFSTAIAAQATSPEYVERLMATTEALTARVDVAALLPCADADACLEAFVQDFGSRAWRRPLEPEEHQRLVSFYASARQTDDADTSVRLLLQVLLQSPQFLFRVERDRGPGVQPVSADELAVRLAAFLWGGPPDDALRLAAQSGALDSRAGVEAQARRMLDDPRAHAQVRRFTVEWLGVAPLHYALKSDAFGDFAALAPHLQEEVGRFGEWAVYEGGGVRALFSARTTFMDEAVAQLYGVDGITGPAWRKVDLSTKQRGGLLTLPGVMAAWAKSDQSSPTRRGRFVREQLLCEPLPPPAANVNMNLPPATFGTTRERFEQHSQDPACSGCHRLMDPVGFGFERYDAIGAFRLVENGRGIDVRGEVLDSSDVDGPFNGALELGEKLAGSEEARQCVARQWFRFAMGRAETGQDACTLEALDRALASSNGDVRELLVTLATSDAMRLRAQAGDAP